MTSRIAINGFGRIGRAAFKIILEHPHLEVVAINDLTDTKTLAHLLRYDTVYGKFSHEVSSTKKAIIVDGKEYPVIAEKDPSALPWKSYKVDVVIECTGRFLSKDKASMHITAGAKKVVLSAPPKGSDIPTVVLGVNQETLKEVCKTGDIISNASCTTNCIAPAAKVMNDNFKVMKAVMTTIHSYTADQNLVDGPHKDLRRARAAAQNIVPTTTGAAISTAETIPDLKGKFDGMAVRVPTPDGSLSDFTFVLGEKVTAEQVNTVFEKAAQKKEYKGILEVTREQIVSSDIIGNTHSSIVDLSLTKVVDGDLVKIVSWYDNEWGYSNRLVDLVAGVCEHLS
ncbi:MAG: type I glyceraldehyde-3-phosphate dehydrogenase [Patescibacteria group bacterium]|jgi:glyceraldehyde 3-phosphate dehydrogenase